MQYNTSYWEYFGKGLTGEGHITVWAKAHALPPSVVYRRRTLPFLFFTRKWPYLITFIACREHAHIIFIRLMLKFNWAERLMAGAFGWLLSHEFCWKKQTSNQTFYNYLFILNKQPSNRNNLNMNFWKITFFIASILLITSGKFKKPLIIYLFI